MRPFVIGIDIGGTNTKLGLINSGGKVLLRTTLPTRSFIRNKTELINAIAAAVQAILKKKKLARKEIAGIGIGLPGLINMKKGTVNFLVNIPRWENVPLKRIMEQKLRLPVFIDNDVNVMTLGEWKFGAGRGIRNLICITLGTGVGGGLVFNNEIYRGGAFTAGEIGHIPLNEQGFSCNCGGYGCLERSVGSAHLLRKAKSVFKNREISLEKITEKARQGDKKAIEFWKEAGRHLGNGLAGVVNLLNPDCLVIGGGIAGAHQVLFKAIEETIRNRAMKIPASMVKIKKAELGQDAGIIGAYVLVQHALSSK